MAIEYVTYIGLEKGIDSFGERNHLVDSEVLVEKVWTPSDWVVLRLVSECKRTGISPSRLIEVLLARS